MNSADMVDVDSERIEAGFDAHDRQDRLWGDARGTLLHEREGSRKRQYHSTAAPPGIVTVSVEGGAVIPASE